MRTLILSLDWDATLFWRDPEGHGKADEASLPISFRLRNRLNQYYRHYSELYIRHNDPVPPLDKRLLDDEGLEIWRQLRAELASVYDVHFYSLEFGCEFNDPEEFVASRTAAHA